MTRTTPPTLRWLLAALLAAGLILLAGCSDGAPMATNTPTGGEVSAGSPTTPAVASDTPTPAPPTPTSEPLAALVNGQPISLAEFEAELARYQAAFPDTAIGEAERQRVLDSLIETVLLAQGAEQAGFTLSAEALEARLAGLVEAAGGQAAFESWLSENSYTPETFRQALAQNVAAAWMRDQLAGQVPASAEQVRARQIFLYNAEEAKNVLDRLQAGTNFVTIAGQTDPATAGELGWFPRGYLLEPVIEEAAFALQPGEYSDVIETRLGFHIVQVIERQQDRPLEPDALRALQRNAVAEWLRTTREQSAIEMLLP
jgi:peptidyl-prolyl cis-trans isomerase C